MSTIIVYGSIFDNFRNKIKVWGETPEIPFNGLGKFISNLIKCILCTSTWVGFFFSVTLGGITNDFVSNEYFSIFFDGMFTAGAVWAINSIVEFFEESRINK